MAIWVVIAYALAVTRLSVLVTADDITKPARDALLCRLDPKRKAHVALGTLATCPWCVSVWIAAAVVPVAWFHGTNLWLLLPALVFAFSQVAGMLSHLGRD